MAALTINEAAETTGWSPRMLRYIERAGMLAPPRSPSGYRLYGPAELQRLRTLRELIAEHDISLGDIGFALRMKGEQELRTAVEAWLAARPSQPDGLDAADWLRFEQEKHERLLRATAETAAA